MVGKKGPRKLLVASVGVATINYALIGCDTFSPADEHGGAPDAFMGFGGKSTGTVPIAAGTAPIFPTGGNLPGPIPMGGFAGFAGQGFGGAAGGMGGVNGGMGGGNGGMGGMNPADGGEATTGGEASGGDGAGGAEGAGGDDAGGGDGAGGAGGDRKSTRLNSSHSQISYAVFCLKKKKIKDTE